MSTVQQFAYRGRNAAGRVVKGRMEAQSQSSVVARMRGMGLSPLAVEPAASGTGLQREISFGGSGTNKRVPLKALAIASRQLATMVGAGLPIMRALAILSEQTENKSLAESLGVVRQDVERGTALSEALGRHPKSFPPLMVHLVRAGETGGFLDRGLNSIADTFEADVKLRSTVKSAMTYPLAVLGIAVIAVVVMLVFIVPIFEKMFRDLGGELPVPTQMLIVLSQNMIWAGPLTALIIAGIVSWYRANGTRDDVRRRVDTLLLKAPVFGPLLRKIAIARFARNLGTMIGAGVPILRALEVVADTSGNWVVERAINRVQDAVRQGRSIAEPLMQEEVIPPMVAQMVAVGEDAGALQIMLEKIADFYDDEVQRTTESLTALLEPMVIALIGLIVGGMIVALYMPMFSIYQQIK